MGDNDKDTRETRYVLMGLLIMAVLAGGVLLLVILIGHGMVGD